VDLNLISAYVSTSYILCQQFKPFDKTEKITCFSKCMSRTFSYYYYSKFTHTTTIFQVNKFTFTKNNVTPIPLINSPLCHKSYITLNLYFLIIATSTRYNNRIFHAQFRYKVMLFELGILPPLLFLQIFLHSQRIFPRLGNTP